MKRPSVLVIDDEPDNFDVIEAFLCKQDYELFYMANGAEAIASLDTFNPDLILLDVMMPGVDGIEVCRHIKAMSKWHSVPIIIVTALSSKTDLVRCLEAGADDFISKPVSAIELRARVHSMLRLKQQYDDLQALLKLREDMVSMIIHDLRNPLTGILLGLKMLTSPDFPEDKKNNKLSQVYSSAQTLQVLVSELLQIALFESNKIRLQRTKVSLNELIQSAVATFEAIADQKNQRISCSLKEVDEAIEVDIVLMQRVLDNLIANAVKFSPHHSQITIDTECSQSSYVIVRVIDSGEGVPEEFKQKIFEKYEVGTLVPDISQIGLGLAFCKMVVEAHGGEICVTNNSPRGSIFQITLPTSSELTHGH